MSVPKGRRTESRFEVLYNATVLHDELLALTLRSFGIYSRNSILRKRYQTLVSNEKNSENIDLAIEGYKTMLLQASNMVEVSLKQAKSFYPNTQSKFDIRIKYQLKALKSCVEIKSILHSITRVFNVDLNIFKEPLQILNKEISLIKSWQRADTRKFKKHFEDS